MNDEVYITTQRRGFTVMNAGDSDVVAIYPNGDTIIIVPGATEKFKMPGNYKLNKDTSNVANVRFSLDDGTFEVIQGTNYDETADLLFSVRFS
jgi:hypothetical protein